MFETSRIDQNFLNYNIRIDPNHLLLMEKVTWPSCIDNLDPPKKSLEGTVSKWVERIYNDNGVFNRDEMLIPVHPIKRLGRCTTDKYPECPNIPKHHIKNSKVLSHIDYLSGIGRYYWFDFNFIDSKGDVIELRMVRNEGDADCNDGSWGEVWERNTKELAADIYCGDEDCETIISVSEKYCDLKFEPYFILEAISESNDKDYIKNNQFEILIWMAIFMA